MKIERVTSIDQVLQCIPFEQEIRNKGRDRNSISTMLLGIREMLPNPLFGFWIAYDDNKIVGYLNVMASPAKPLKRLIVLRIYAPTKKVQHKFEDLIVEFGKENKIKPGVMMTEVFKHDKVLIRKGWKKISTIMEKRLY